MKWMKNEILEELWKVKDQLAEDYGYDIEKLAKGLRAKEKNRRQCCGSNTASQDCNRDEGIKWKQKTKNVLFVKQMQR